MQSRQPQPLRAGVGKIEISPAIGIQIAGDIGRYRPCTSIKEPIYARAVVLERDGKRFCIIATDLAASDGPWAAEIRRRVHHKFAIPPDAVIVHCSQNHAAPALGNYECRDSCTLIPAQYPWLRGGDPRYNEVGVAGILAAVGRAVETLTPVTVAAGRAIDGRVAVNRRYVMRDGTSRCQPPICSPDILHVEGPTDPEVGVVTFTDANGRVIAALLHHTSHPCNGFWGNAVLPDWPGSWCQEMEAHFGAGCTPLVINGCCGNVITYHYLNPDQPEAGGDYHEMGRMLAQSTKRALAQMTPVADTGLAWASRIVPIPRREVPDQVLADAQKMLRDNPEPLWIDQEHIRVSWDWVYSVGIIDMADQLLSEPNEPYEIQAVRLGNFALLALVGEPFVEAQLNIKRRAPFQFLQVAHMCNGYAGYIPTRRALAGGSYETNIGWSSRLAPAALEMIEDESVALLKGLAG